MSRRYVSAPVMFWPGDPDALAVPITARFYYDAADPFAVRMVFPGLSGTGEDGITWEFSRALLVDGIDEPTGEGEVRIAPAEATDWVTITLLPEPGTGLALHAPRETIARFLAGTFALVPMGREAARIDWNAELDAVLGGAA
jgi:hypothetical protein